jgi:glycerol-3-phosphate dehydrogenase (NAD(P)+)
MTDSRSVLVLGAGSWGTALAMVLARNSIKTYLWDIDRQHIDALQQQACNSRHLDGIQFPKNLHAVHDLKLYLEKVDTLLIVVPCHALQAVLTEIQSMGQTYKICLACKGLEPESHRLNHILVQEYLGQVETAVLSGPSFAREVAEEVPTAVTIASETPETATYFTQCFHNQFFRTYTHNDIVGVQVGGAVKNVMAIAAGISDGLEFWAANVRRLWG